MRAACERPARGAPQTGPGPSRLVTTIEDAPAGLGELLTDIGDQPVERPADEVVRGSAAARQRVDDVAVLPLRARDDG